METSTVRIPHSQLSMYPKKKKTQRCSTKTNPPIVILANYNGGIHSLNSPTPNYRCIKNKKQKWFAKTNPPIVMLAKSRETFYGMTYINWKTTTR